MSLSQVRGYIKSRVETVDTDFREWKDAFNIENIPNNLIDLFYHIDIGTITSTPASDVTVEDSVPATLRIFKRATTNTSAVEVKDEILDKAHCLRIDIINPRNFEDYKAANSGDIAAVETLSITPTTVDETNDNLILVEIELNVRLIFCPL